MKISAVYFQFLRYASAILFMTLIIFEIRRSVITVPQICNVVNLEEPPEKAELLNCFKVKERIKPVYMCTYEDEYEFFISTHSIMWKGDITSSLRSLLEGNPEVGFVNIGANTGIHALQIASLGRQVLAVEHIYQHVRRLHQAIRLNNFTRQFVLLQNAVSSNRSKIAMRDVGGAYHGGVYEVFPTGAVGIQRSILMDDLLEVIKFKEAVVKIGGRHATMVTEKAAARFFRNVRVHGVIMEWHLPADLGQNSPLLNSLMKMNNFLYRRGFRPFNANGSEPLPIEWNLWTAEIVWLKVKNNHELP